MFSVWNGLLLAVAALRVMFAVDSLCYQRKRQRFLADREPTADRSFLEGLESDAPANVCLAVRDALAGQCGLPSQMLAPGDSLNTLWEFPFTGFDLLDFVFRLEDALGRPLPRSTEQCIGESLKPLVLSSRRACLADFVNQVATAIVESFGVPELP
jgi:hypothetical protein